MMINANYNDYKVTIFVINSKIYSSSSFFLVLFINNFL